MHNKQKNSYYFFILVAIVSLSYIVFGLFMAFKNEKTQDKPVRSEEKGIFISNENIHTIEEVKDKCNCKNN